jgi:hypothetical protein
LRGVAACTLAERGRYAVFVKDITVASTLGAGSTFTLALPSA